jgi:hypothetical protein
MKECPERGGNHNHHNHQGLARPIRYSTEKDFMVHWEMLSRIYHRVEAPGRDQHELVEDPDMRNAEWGEAGPPPQEERDEMIFGNGALALITHVTNMTSPSTDGAEDTEHTVLGRLLDLCNHLRTEEVEDQRRDTTRGSEGGERVAPSSADNKHFDGRIVLQYNSPGEYVAWDTEEETEVTMKAEMTPAALISRFWGGQGTASLKEMSQNKEDDHGRDDDLPTPNAKQENTDPTGRRESVESACTLEGRFHWSTPPTVRQHPSAAEKDAQ